MSDALNSPSRRCAANDVKHFARFQYPERSTGVLVVFSESLAQLHHNLFQDKQGREATKNTSVCGELLLSYEYAAINNESLTKAQKSQRPLISR